MTAIKKTALRSLYLPASRALFFLLFGLASLSLAQEQTAPAVTPGSSNHEETVSEIRLQEFEDLAIQSLRRELPRFSGVLASVHSCRLPDFGPLISIAIQPPPYYFTRPVLQELERRQRAAEEQARRMRIQIERTAQVITLRVKLAELEVERTMKPKGKVSTGSIEREMDGLRKSLEELEGKTGESTVTVIVDPLTDADLNKMMQSNYEQLVQRVTVAMTNTLVENSVRLADLKEEERIGIATYIRSNFTGTQEKSIVFVLSGTHIRAYRQGALDLPALKTKVIIKQENKE